jgi:hypothetical protein
MVHGATMPKRTVAPDTVHTVVVVEAKVTANPELATAVTVYPGPSTVAPDGGVEVNVTSSDAGVTVSVPCT